MSSSSSPLPPTFLPGWHMEDEVKKMNYVQLGKTDMMVSPVGLGGSPMGGVYADKGDLEEIFKVRWAHFPSYTHCSPSVWMLH